MPSAAPAVLVDESVQRLRAVLDLLSARSLDVRGFSDAGAALRYVRDEGADVLFVSASAQPGADAIARAARGARDGEPLWIVLCGAPLPDGGPFDDALPSRDAHDVVRAIEALRAPPRVNEAEPSAGEALDASEVPNDEGGATSPSDLPPRPPPEVVAPKRAPALAVPREAPDDRGRADVVELPVGPPRPTPLAEIFARYRLG